ncbi:MAG: zf-HC2 domain-containing protein [Gemmatimonadetes bacterium]|nr:zf-HC2 domain-containing protein [Gemmatimonadota bacterium]
MNSVIGTVPHPSDGDMVRYLDTELSELEERRLRTHLNGCAQCTARLEAIASQSSAVARYIGQTGLPGPDAVTRARALALARRASVQPRRGWRRLRLAAAACALFVLALTAYPVRAWIAERWDGFRAPAAAPTEAATLPASVVRRSSVVAFTPRGDRFDLQIESFQPAGTLTVEVRDLGRATAQVLNGANETMLILPDGIRVENRAGSRASYLVTVPANLPLLSISVGGETVATVNAVELNAPWSRSFSLRAR